MFPGYRASDAMITVRQDNARRAVEIRAMNGVAEEALGYALPAVSGLPLAALLPDRIRQLLEEYVEFEDDGNDVGGVLAKVQRFCVLHRDGKEIAYRLKVLRGEPEDGAPCFHLVLQSTAGDRRSEAFRAVLRENFKGHEVLEPRTQLPDRQSILKDIEFVRHYVNKEALTASVAVLALDEYDALRDQHGESACVTALSHIAALARQNLRADDITGCIGERQLALILLDTTSDSARMVLNRLRWLVAASPLPLGLDKETVPVTASIAFSRLNGHAVDRDMLPRLEEKAEALCAGPGNALAEVAE